MHYKVESRCGFSFIENLSWHCHLTTGVVVAYVEVYQGVGVVRSTAVQILPFTGVTVANHLLLYHVPPF